MTDEKTVRRYPRNTKELPVSEAIAKLRENESERAKEHAKVDEERDRRARHVLLRVPEIVRTHVAEQGGFDRPAPASAPPSEPGDGEEEMPKGALPLEPERAERIGRLTGGPRR